MISFTGLSSCRIRGSPTTNQPMAAEIILQNPLPEPFENCSFCVERTNLTHMQIIAKYDRKERVQAQN